LKIIDIKKNELFEKVKEILEWEFGALPTDCIIAGQAVASAVYKALDLPIQGPFNDLDVFLPVKIYENKDPNKYRALCKENDVSLDDKVDVYVNQINLAPIFVSPRQKKQKSNLVRTAKSKATMSRHHSYDLISKFSFDSTCTILRTAQNKDNMLINEILVSLSYVDDLSCLLDTFDLNCVQVGINPKNKTIHWTPEFEAFLHSRQLDVAWCGTPMHTAVRAEKKYKELKGVFMDRDKIQLKLQTFRQAIKYHESIKNMLMPGCVFSDHYKDKYEVYGKELKNRYWNIVDIKDREIPLYQLEPVSYCHKTIDLYTRLVNNFNTMPPYKSVEHHYSLISDLFDLYNNTEKKLLDRTIDIVNNVIDATSTLVSLPIKSFSEKQKNTAVGLSHVMNFALVPEQFKINQVDPTSIQKIVKLITNHQEFGNILEQYSAKDAVKIAEVLNWADKNEFKQVIGMFNDVGSASVSLPLNPDMNYSLDDLLVHGKSLVPKMNAEYIEKIKDKKVDPVLEPIVNSKMFNDASIKEITSAVELMNEGIEQKHCVGGYWFNVEKRELLVFSIITPDRERTTLSLIAGVDRDGKIEPLREHDFKSKNNQEPSENHQVISSDLINFLNNDEKVQSNIRKSLKRQIIEMKNYFKDADPSEDIPF